MNRAELNDLYNDFYDMVYDLALVFESVPQEDHAERAALRDVLKERARTQFRWARGHEENKTPYHEMKPYAEALARAAHDLQYIVGPDAAAQTRTKLLQIAAATLIMLEEHDEQYEVQ